MPRREEEPMDKASKVALDYRFLPLVCTWILCVTGQAIQTKLGTNGDHWHVPCFQMGTYSGLQFACRSYEHLELQGNCLGKCILKMWILSKTKLSGK